MASVPHSALLRCLFALRIFNSSFLVSSRFAQSDAFVQSLCFLAQFFFEILKNEAAFSFFPPPLHSSLFLELLDVQFLASIHIRFLYFFSLTANERMCLVPVFSL